MKNIILESFNGYIKFNNIKYYDTNKFIKFDEIINNNNKRIIVHNHYQNYKGNVINKKRYGFTLKKFKKWNI